MKNTLPFAALTFAFTIVGASVGYSIKDPAALATIVLGLASVGAFASAVSMYRD